MTHERQEGSGRPAGYEVRVRGELGAAGSDWFAGQAVTRGPDGETVVTGIVDLAALHAVLRRVRDLGLCLVAMQRIEPDRGTPAASASTHEREDHA